MMSGIKSEQACQLSVEEVAATLKADLDNGLSSYEVRFFNFLLKLLLVRR